MSILEDKDAIREVMAAYCHAIDACRFADVASLFADDGIWTTDYGEAEGRDAIERMLRSVVPMKGEGPQRKHYITNIIIKVDGDSAVSVSDYLVVRESGLDLIPVMGGTDPLNAAASLGAFAASTVETCRSESIALVFFSRGLGLLASSAFSPS